MNNGVYEILVTWLWNLGAVLAAFALLAGLLLIFAPGWTLSIARYLNREYSFAWLLRALDAPRVTEPFIYRHHRVVGVFLTLGAAYLLKQLFTAVTAEAAAELWGGAMPPALALAVMQAFYWLFLIGGLAGFVLGIVIFVRPSALKPLERWSNSWLSTDKVTETLDRRDDRPEGLAHRHPRVVGLVIVAATLYIVLMLGLLIT